MRKKIITTISAGGGLCWLVLAGMAWSAYSQGQDAIHSACQVKKHNPLPVSVDDDQYYVRDIINGAPDKWDGQAPEGKMMIIVQKGKKHDCYAVVSPDAFTSVPEEYTQITTQAMILPQDDSGERKLVAVTRHFADAAPHL